VIGNFAVLTHPQQDLIDRWLLAGKSVRWVASQTDPPVSFGAIQRYRKKLLGPALKRVAAKLPSVANLPVGAKDGEQASRPLHAVTGDELADERVSPFLERVNLLWQECLKGMHDARSAVRMHTDAKGNVVIDGRDFAVFAQMLGQAHRNMELFGRGTGALSEQPGVNLNVITPVAVTIDPLRIGQLAPPDQAIALPAVVEIALPDEC